MESGEERVSELKKNKRREEEKKKEMERKEGEKNG